MSYTAVVTKESVSKIGNNLYMVSIKMVVNDGAIDVLEATIGQEYNTAAPDLADVKARLVDELRKQWDKYAAEHNIFSAAAFDSMVSQIQTAANTYINA